jgi:hypothetical protein
LFGQLHDVVEVLPITDKNEKSLKKCSQVTTTSGNSSKLGIK